MHPSSADSYFQAQSDRLLTAEPFVVLCELKVFALSYAQTRRLAFLADPLN
jgi:hypothetical protein